MSVLENKNIPLNSFETLNRFNVFNTLTSDKVEDLMKGKRSTIIKCEKKKCRSCNYITMCHLNPAMCRAREKQCSKCLKMNHYPKSKNCAKTRKEKFEAKKNQSKEFSGCHTLRFFLKSRKCHLKDLKLNWNPVNIETVNINGNSINKSSNYDGEDIAIYVKLVERKVALTKRVLSICQGGKIILLLYLFLNLDTFLIQKEYQYPSKEEVLVLQNHVTLKREQKVETPEVNNEEIFTKNLEETIRKSEKLVKARFQK